MKQFEKDSNTFGRSKCFHRTDGTQVKRRATKRIKYVGRKKQLRKKRKLDGQRQLRDRATKFLGEEATKLRDGTKT